MEINQEELIERLDILHSSDMISDHIYITSKEVLQLLISAIDDLDQEKMEMFITHFAMAMQRVEVGDVSFTADRAIVESLKKEPVYNESKRLFKEIANILQINVPKEEKDLLLIHLCNILTSREEG